MINEEKTTVAEELLNLKYNDIVVFDEAAAENEALPYYEQSQILDAVVFRNKLSARVGNYFESNRVRLAMHGKELSSRCTCDSEKQICIHAVALLYAWVNDAQDFMNLADVLAEIEMLEKSRVIEIVANILQQQPHLANDFLQKNKPDWDEIDQDLFDKADAFTLPDLDE
jgi:uncharacterized Zn finger protein